MRLADFSVRLKTWQVKAPYRGISKPPAKPVVMIIWGKRNDSNVITMALSDDRGDSRTHNCDFYSDMGAKEKKTQPD